MALSFLALISPLFVMNVYDRAAPKQAMENMWVLTCGTLLALSFDFLMRLLHSYFIDLAGKKSDVLLSATLFGRVPGLRMAFPPAR